MLGALGDGLDGLVPQPPEHPDGDPGEADEGRYDLVLSQVRSPLLDLLAQKPLAVRSTLCRQFFAC